jgi:hypothetical protein
MVISLTEYSYARQFVSAPFVVGSSLLKSKMQGEGAGFVFRDTRVAGLHPYAGDRFILNLALYRVETQNYLTDAIKFLESVSGVFNESLSLLLKNFVKTANVVIDGINGIVDRGNVNPIFGIRKEFDPATQDVFAPGYYVMLDKSARNWEPANFSVSKDNSLMYLKDQTPRRFREDEYILFSINKTDSRSDVDQLPVYKGFDDILDFAQKFPEMPEEQKTKIKGMLYALKFELLKSPDLTTEQAGTLIDQFIAQVKAAVEKKINWGATGAAAPPDKWDTQIADL